MLNQAPFHQVASSHFLVSLLRSIPTAMPFVDLSGYPLPTLARPRGAILGNGNGIRGRYNDQRSAMRAGPTDAFVPTVHPCSA
jgi:hypothetical protein